MEILIVITCFTPGSVVPGGGAFEVAAYVALTSTEFLSTVAGRAKYGVKVSGRISLIHYFLFLRLMLKLL